MTIALKIQSRQPANSAKPHRFRNPASLIPALLYRLWWHTYSYTTILGVLMLTLLSLIVISVHRQVSKGLAGIRQGINSSVKLLR